MTDVRDSSTAHAPSVAVIGSGSAGSVAAYRLRELLGPDARIEVDPKARGQQREQVTILLHKPMGYVSGQAEDGYEPAVVLVQGRNRWREDRAPQRTAGLPGLLAPDDRDDQGAHQQHDDGDRPGGQQCQPAGGRAQHPAVVPGAAHTRPIR